MNADAPVDGAVALGGRYVLGELVGRGGMAQVYRAHDRVLDRTVAVKVLRAIAATDEERARFSDEARMLAALDHPGLVTVLDAATSDHEPYLVMEFVDGPNLAEHCRDEVLEPERVADIGAQLADALHYVHAAGIVHRDLKPGNVLLGADGRARLTDFGLARILSAALRHTTTGATVGTPAYLAPEQVRGGEITPAVDVYALGLVLIEALTGTCPYQGLPVEAALARLTTPPAIPDELPRPWHVLLRAMTALDPADRPSTTAVAAALRRLAAGTDEPAWSLRRVVAERWHLAAGVTAGVLLMVLTGVWYEDRADDRPRRPATTAPDAGEVTDDLSAPRVAPNVRNVSEWKLDEMTPVAPGTGRRVDARPVTAHTDAATRGRTANDASQDAPATPPQTAAGDDGETVAEEPADPVTVPVAAPGDDDTAGESDTPPDEDTDGEDAGSPPGNGNAYGVGNGAAGANGNAGGNGNGGGNNGLAVGRAD